MADAPAFLTKFAPILDELQDRVTESRQLGRFTWFTFSQIDKILMQNQLIYIYESYHNNMLFESLEPNRNMHGIQWIQAAWEFSFPVHVFTVYLPFPDIKTSRYCILTVLTHRISYDDAWFTDSKYVIFAALHFSEGSGGRQQNCGSGYNDRLFGLHLAWFLMCLESLPVIGFHWHCVFRGHQKTQWVTQWDKMGHHF